MEFAENSNDGDFRNELPNSILDVHKFEGIIDGMQEQNGSWIEEEHTSEVLISS